MSPKEFICERKRPYQKLEAIEKAIEKSIDLNTRIDYYQCPFAEHYHIGHYRKPKQFGGKIA